MEKLLAGARIFPLCKALYVKNHNMNIREELLKNIPTVPAKRILLLLLALITFSWFALGEIDPLWLNISSLDLLKAKICLTLFLAFIFSLVLNIYYIYKLKKLGKFIDNKIPELADKIATHEIDKIKSKHGIN